jgi:hypothetical protein
MGAVLSHPFAMKLRKDGAPIFSGGEGMGHPPC